jgi:hypothetical protein
MDFKREDEMPPAFEMLKSLLVETYGASHPGILYEAPSLPLCCPRCEEKALGDLAPQDFRPETTFVIKPLPNDPRRNEDFQKLIR